jgi:hypothetical protein
MNWVRALFVATLASLATLPARSAWADDSVPRAAASQHFDRGLSLAKQGDLVAALEEFETAYALSPHYSVLYNLGQTHAALGDPVAAVGAFEQYLAQGADRVPTARRTEVASLVERLRRRIGSLELVVRPEDVDVHIDGRKLDSKALGGPIPLNVGTHGLSVSRAGYTQQSKPVEIAGESTTRMAIHLDREQSDRGNGYIQVSCPLVDMSVTVGGRRLATTPVDAPLPFPAGDTAIVFERPGYVRSERPIVVPKGRVLVVSCKPRPDASWRGPTGRLTVETSEPSARIEVDGIAYDSRRLPVGRHVVEIEHAGFRPWRQDVSVSDNGDHRVFVNLQPTKERVAEQDAAARRQRNWALGFGIAGLGLSTAATTLYIWNSGRHSEWLDDRHALDEKLTSGAPPGDLVDEVSSMRARAVDIQQTDDVVGGLAIVGGAALVTSVVLWLTADREP